MGAKIASISAFSDQVKLIVWSTPSNLRFQELSAIAQKKRVVLRDLELVHLQRSFLKLKPVHYCEDLC